MATRKGLFSFVRGPGGEGWATERVSFLGDAVSMVFHDTRDGAQGSLYAAAQPEGQVETFSDGKPWPWRVEQIWALERGAVDVELWCETIGGGLFRSRDRAASWELSRSLRDHPQRKAWLGSGADLPGIHSICLHPQDARSSMIGVSCGGVWRTNDDGASWERSADGMFADYMPPNLRSEPSIQDPHRIVQCPSAIDRVWCQHHNGVFRSDDGGRTWNEVANVKPAVFGFAVAIHPTDPDTAWLIPAVEDETRVPVDAKVVAARARDAGKTWQVLDRGLPAPPAYDLAFRHALDVDEKGDRLAFGSTTDAP